MTFGSLFAGIGGFDLGLERAGMECKWQVEINDYATKVLEKHWPNVKRFRDVHECGVNNLESVDLICGGFPCQDISVAGKGKGLSGERSGLWWQFHRIIKEIKPKYALIENVPALRSRGLDQILRSLFEVGYDAEWHCIPAAAFGAPHRRDRVWIVAYRQSDGRGQGDAHSGGGEEGMAPRQEQGLEHGGEAVADAKSQQNRRVCQSEFQPDFGASGQIRDTTIKRFSDRAIFEVGRSKEKPKLERSDWWAVEPDVGRVAHGVPKRVDRLKCLGNAVVPQIVEWIGKKIIEACFERRGR